MADFSDRLSDLMFEKNIKSRELAAMLGVNVSSVNDWKRGRFLMSLSNLIKIADIFDCSLEFLLGRSETFIDYTPKPCPPFYPCFRAVMEEKGITSYRMQTKSPVKPAYFNQWCKGADPLVASVLPAADFLGVTLDYLVGRDSNR